MFRILFLCVSALFTGCNLFDNSLNAQEVSAACEAAINAKDTDAAVQNCVFAEQFLARVSPESLEHAQMLELSADALQSINPSMATDHYQHAVILREKLGETSWSLQALQIKYAVALGHQGNWRDAAAVLKKVLDKITAEKRLESLDAADILSRYGAMQLHLQDLPGAEQSLRKALSIRINQVDNSSPALGDIYNTLGMVMQAQGKLQDAERFYHSAIYTLEALDPMFYQSLFEALNNLSTLLQQMGKTGEAEQYWRKLLPVAEKGYGKDTLQYALVLNNLGAISLAAGQYPAAELTFRESLTVRAKILGDSSLLTAESADNLALALANQGKYALAYPLMQHAVAVSQILLGLNNPLTLQRTSNLKTIEKFLSNTAAAPAQPAKVSK